MQTVHPRSKTMAPPVTKLSVIDEKIETQSRGNSHSFVESQDFKEKNERSKKILKDIRQLTESVFLHLQCVQIDLKKMEDSSSETLVRNLEEFVKSKFEGFNEYLAQLKSLAANPSTLNLGSIRNNSLKVSKSVQVKMNLNEFIRKDTQTIFLNNKPVSLRNEILFSLPKKTDDIVKLPSTTNANLVQENN